MLKSARLALEYKEFTNNSISESFENDRERVCVCWSVMIQLEPNTIHERWLGAMIADESCEWLDTICNGGWS